MKALSYLIATSVVAGFSAPVSAATLIGDTVNCFRNGVACSGTSSAIVSGGLEFDRSSSTYNFDANGLTVTTFLTNGSSFVTPLVYSFENSTNPFQSFSNLSITGFSNFDSSRVNFANGRISIDLSGVNSNGRVSLNLATSGAVPEPATWAMLILGFFGVGAAIRSARRKQNVTVSYA
ncbi:PEPxxWA-CTERM sorting domain-containing protein [Porphyrobacter sp. CACIAM 03H1]|uniref:PEPxxWA-CTERM sorting domain-containing protein n=1 Tax=Porphyrobacter sp. CACIAM 03H1 TaxID=2003315 RepID=UPI000B5AB328|nr:hypothetical protein CBR61_04600 [Porphyrobacter sp. CACIAM 03H1]